MRNEWEGPICGVTLLKDLPLDGGMTQALPSRSDLESIRSHKQGQRVVAGYEVLLEHYYRLQDECCLLNAGLQYIAGYAKGVSTQKGASS